MIKRQLSVHIDFPVLCGVRLEPSGSVPAGVGRQWPLCEEEGGQRRAAAASVTRVVLVTGHGVQAEPGVYFTTVEVTRAEHEAAENNWTHPLTLWFVNVMFFKDQAAVE